MESGWGVRNSRELMEDGAVGKMEGRFWKLGFKCQFGEIKSEEVPVLIPWGWPDEVEVSISAIALSSRLKDQFQEPDDRAVEVKSEETTSQLEWPNAAGVSFTAPTPSQSLLTQF